MINFIRRYPATFKKFAGWVYTKYGHTPQYLEFNQPRFTYGLLREFFGASPMIPQGLVTETDYCNNAKPILDQYEATLPPEKPITPKPIPAPRSDVITTNDPEEEALWDMVMNTPGPDVPF